MTKKVNKTDEIVRFKSAEQIEKELKIHEHCAQMDLFSENLLPEDPRRRENSKLYRMREAYKYELKKAANIKQTLDKRFTMFFEEFDLVLNWLFENSKRPAKECGKVWSKMCFNLIPSTRQVALTREELAEQTGVKKCDVSTIIKELERIRAVRVEYEKVEGARFKRALYFINAHICQNGRLLTPEELAQEDALNLEQATAAQKSAKEGKGLQIIKGGLLKPV
ncbi:MAG: hypothetical protein H7707_05160 [Acetobacter sp.]|nr:hypothetical protein [Acetobacter sp.]